MIIDKPTGFELIPGNGGRDCPGNGENGNEICCDECNYLCCCINHFRKNLAMNVFIWNVPETKIMH